MGLFDLFVVGSSASIIAHLIVYAIMMISGTFIVMTYAVKNANCLSNPLSESKGWERVRNILHYAFYACSYIVVGAMIMIYTYVCSMILEEEVAFATTVPFLVIVNVIEFAIMIGMSAAVVIDKEITKRQHAEARVRRLEQRLEKYESNEENEIDEILAKLGA